MADRKEKNIDLSIITINYHTDELILDLLEKLSPHRGVEIIIVDNSKTDSLRQKLPHRKDIHYFFAGENLGFAGGNNLGLSCARGDWLMLLNSDTLVSTRDVLKLLSATKSRNFFVSAPQLIQLDSKIQDNVALFDGLFTNPINHIFARPRFLRCNLLHEPRAVDVATGAAILVHNSVFHRVGLLDDKRFFMYFEDIDFSYRLYRQRIQVLYYPDVRILHFGGMSSDQDIRQKNLNYQNGLRVYLTKHRGRLIALLNSIFHFFN